MDGHVDSLVYSNSKKPPKNPEKGFRTAVPLAYERRGPKSVLSFFFLAVFWGIGMCLAYDGLRILRNLIRHSLFWINAEDLLYWAVMTAVLFYLLFTYNRG